MTFCGQGLVAAQVSVPFVGCESEGYNEPLPVPVGKHKNVAVTTRAAGRLAFHKAAAGFGVLAPRGWYCFGVYGSAGYAIYVSPLPIDGSKMFTPDWAGSTDPLVKLELSDGETSGRYSVARIVARVFPGHKEYQPASEYPSGPYPSDKLKCKSDDVVEYHTPADTEGLGTEFGLKESALPIDGVAIFIKEGPSTVLLSVRLPPGFSVLAPSIIRQVERDVVRKPRK